MEARKQEGGFRMGLLVMAAIVYALGEVLYFVLGVAGSAAEKITETVKATASSKNNVIEEEYFFDYCKKCSCYCKPGEGRPACK